MAGNCTGISRELRGGANPEVLFEYEIRGKNSIVETKGSFKVQLTGRSDIMLELIRKKLYNNSVIEKEGNNEVKIKSNVRESSDINPRAAVNQLRGGIEGPGVLFLTRESSIIVSSSKTNAADSQKLARNHEPIGRIVTDFAGVRGSAIQNILKALQPRQSKSVVVTKVVKVTK